MQPKTTFQHYRRVIAIASIFILLALGPIAGFLTFSPQKAQASWYNDNWTYRQVIPVSTHATSETNVYIEISIDTATLTTDKLQADCDDLRFTKVNGEILPYQIVSGCDTATTIINVGFDTMPIAPFDFYMYFGNPSASAGATTISHTACASTCTEGSLGSEEKGPGQSAYWKFDEGTGTSTSDSSVNNNDGTISGATWLTEDFCVIGKCLRYDGSDDVTTVTNATAIDLNDNLAAAHSFSVWFRASTDGEGDAGQIYQKGTTTYLRVDSQSGSNVDVEASVDLATTDATVNISAPITTNTWNHVVVVYTDDSDDEIDIYINGNLRGSSTNGSGAPAADTNNLLIGGTTTANFHGEIDEFKVYNFARTSAQIKTDFDSRGTGKGAGVSFGQNAQNLSGTLSNGLVGYWKEDEASFLNGTVDSSGNSTLLTDSAGGVTTAIGKFGNGGDFESANSEYFYAADNAILSVTGSLTLTAWIKPETVTSGTYNIIAKWDGSNEMYRMYQLADEIVLEIETGNTVTSDAANLAASTFYHVAGVYDASTATAKIYINGSLAGTTPAGTIPSSITDDGGRFHIGSEDSTTTAANFYDGVIDEARVYNRVLTLSEVEGLYNFAPGPVGYWNFEEKTGTTANDLSGNANTGTITAGTGGWIGGKYGSAYNFDSAATVVNAGSAASLDDLPASGMTVEAWIYPKSAGENSLGYIVAKNTGSAATNGWYLRMDSTTTLEFDVDGSTDLSRATNTGNTTITQNAWNHVAVSWDGVITTASSVNIYINGALSSYATSVNGASRTSDASSTFFIGNNSLSSQTFDGLIDEVRVYNFARTQGQIVEDMNAGHPAPGSPVGTPYGWWKFDEGALNTCLVITTRDACNSGYGGADWDGAFTADAGFTNSARFGKAVTFDGTGDFVTIGDLTGTEGATRITWTFWVNPTTLATSRCLFCKVNDPNGTVAQASWAIMTDGTDSSIIRGIVTSANGSVGTYGSSPASTLANGTWAYIAIVYDGTLANSERIKIYLNGRAVATTITGTIPTTGPASATGNGLRVGTDSANSASTAFTGVIDEAKVYLSALTPDQVKLDMNRGSSEVLGALSDNSSYQVQAKNQVYCVPGYTTTCTAPVSAWELDEKQGITAFDTGETSNNNLTLTNTPTWTSGKFGGGINLAGSNQHLTRTDDVDFDIGAGGSFTWEAWIRHNSASATETIISKLEATGGDGGYKLKMESDGDITCETDDNDADTTIDDTVSSTAATYDDNKWHHITCVKNASTSISLYIDGAFIATDSTVSTATLGNDDALFVGIETATGTEDWIGQIDQISFFNYARTAAQIAWDYNRGGPVGYWKFDECQGTTLNDASITNANNGTWSGAGGGNTSAGTCTTPTDGTGAWYDGRTGKINSSLDFDGSDDVVTVANAPAIDHDEVLKNAISYAAWFYPHSDGESDAGQIFEKSVFEGDYCRVESEAGGLDITCQMDLLTTNATVTITNVVSTNTWNHIVVTYTDDSDDEIDVYINGILRGSSTNGVGAPEGQTDTGSLKIGGITTANFDGQIDEFMVFSYGLTAPQVKTLYNSGAVRFGPATGTP